MIEFDHHSGVFLTNAEPAKCHIQTVIPNGNHYCKDLLRRHYAQVHGAAVAERGSRAEGEGGLGITLLRRHADQVSSRRNLGKTR